MSLLPWLPIHNFALLEMVCFMIMVLLSEKETISFFQEFRQWMVKEMRLNFPYTEVVVVWLWCSWLFLKLQTWMWYFCTFLSNMIMIAHSSSSANNATIWLLLFCAISQIKELQYQITHRESVATVVIFDFVFRAVVVQNWAAVIVIWQQCEWINCL